MLVRATAEAGPWHGAESAEAGEPRLACPGLQLGLLVPAAGAGSIDLSPTSLDPLNLLVDSTGIKFLGGPQTGLMP